MTKKSALKKESPLTISQLSDFFNKIIMPELDAVKGEIRSVQEEVAEIKGLQEDLYKKWEDLRTEYHVICAQLDRMEEKLNRIEAKLDLEIQERKILGEELPKLKQQVVFLQTRIEELERQKSSH